MSQLGFPKMMGNSFRKYRTLTTRASKMHSTQIKEK